MNKKEITYRTIDELKHPDYNPRQIKKEQFEQLKQSLRRFEAVEPAVINKAQGRENIIVGGNQRIRAAGALGWKEFPCVYVDLPLELEKELNVRLNANTGEWDYDILANEFDIELLEEWGLESLPFDSEAVNNEGLTDEDAVPEEVEPICKVGDLWQLGEHRLLCGDSTKKEDVERLMDGKKADMVFTDPPYGMKLDVKQSNNITWDKDGWKGKSKNYDNVIGDHGDFKDDFINNIFGLFEYCKEIFLWGADYYSDLLREKNDGSWFVWNKTRNSEDKEQIKSNGSMFELCWSKKKHKREVVNVLWKGLMGTELQDIRTRVHPTQKPIQICEWFIEKFSKNSETVTDLFLGSGSTLIACEKTNRICYGMEIDPHYCDVTIKRWEDFTGSKAVKI